MSYCSYSFPPLPLVFVQKLVLRSSRTYIHQLGNEKTVIVITYFFIY